MTQEDVKKQIDKAKEQMAKAVDFLEDSIAHIRAGKADVRVLDNVMVDYYGSQMSLSQVSNVTVPDARTIKIQPWEKKMFDVISKAIMVSNLGFNPTNNGGYNIIVAQLYKTSSLNLLNSITHFVEKSPNATILFI